jgi:hypothetical protein
MASVALIKIIHYNSNKIARGAEKKIQRFYGGRENMDSQLQTYFSNRNSASSFFRYISTFLVYYCSLGEPHKYRKYFSTFSALVSSAHQAKVTNTVHNLSEDDVARMSNNNKH